MVDEVRENSIFVSSTSAERNGESLHRTELRAQSTSSKIIEHTPRATSPSTDLLLLLQVT
ncbi:hypothetical protein Hypma_011476 [Hypsizygus marmoreus]|uniref:Uncharacterized protein n=1 Tax=Hypsizygus marmoreus TaxID=39966 RepID=A0A369JLK2_HYPMA|nr:hypothetical protein Hypma_011476 [Hypsizygus marmoreus]